MGAIRKCSPSSANNRKYCCSGDSFSNLNCLLTYLHFVTFAQKFLQVFLRLTIYGVVKSQKKKKEGGRGRKWSSFRLVGFLFCMVLWQPIVVSRFFILILYSPLLIVTMWDDKCLEGSSALLAVNQKKSLYHWKQLPWKRMLFDDIGLFSEQADQTSAEMWTKLNFHILVVLG